MKPQKKREHVKGAWWYIVGIIALVAWCAETGHDPGVILSVPALLFVLFWVCSIVFCLVAAILGGNGRGK